MKTYHVKKAAKDYPEDGIIKGQEYWYAEPKRRKAGKRYFRSLSLSKLLEKIQTYSKSFMGEFASNMQNYQERMESLSDTDEKAELIADVLEFIDQKESSLESIPYQLQESHVINEQLDELRTLVEELEELEIESD